MTTTVVNIKHDNYDVYIGRGTPFGNPFIVDRDGTRDEVIAKFKVYFNTRLRYDELFGKLVQELKGKVLGCHCKPLTCHGDVIAEYLNVMES